MFQKAENAFRAGLEKRPDSANMRAGLMQAVAGQNHCAEAADLAWSLRDKKAVTAPVASSMAGCFARSEDYAEAEYWQQFALATGESKVEDWTRLALFQFRLGDDAIADASLEKAWALEPMHWRVSLVRAIVASGRGDWEACQHALESVDILADRDRQIRWMVAAQLSMDLGDLEQAFQELKHAATLGDRSPTLMALRAEAYRRAGWLEDARRVTIAQAPSNMSSLRFRLAIARVEADDGATVRPRSILKKALEAHPRMPLVLSTAWYVAWIQGQESIAQDFAARYERVRTSPLRDLRNLIPAGRLK